jgi:hypothetical protein
MIEEKGRRGDLDLQREELNLLFSLLLKVPSFLPIRRERRELQNEDQTIHLARNHCRREDASK